MALNLRYNDPAIPVKAARWNLVAKTNTASSQGIVGLVIRFDGGTMPATGVVNSGIGHDINGPLKIGSFDHDPMPALPTRPSLSMARIRMVQFLGNRGQRRYSYGSERTSISLIRCGNDAVWDNVSVIADRDGCGSWRSPRCLFR